MFYMDFEFIQQVSPYIFSFEVSDARYDSINLPCHVYLYEYKNVLRQT